MRSLIAVVVMVVWSALIALVMYWIGFSQHMHDPLWSVGAAVALLIGLIGNVWIFFLIVKEEPWAWFKSGGDS